MEKNAGSLYGFFIKNVEYIIISLFFLWLIANIFFGERLPIGNGLGWDGTIYADIARNFSYLVFHHQLDQYRIQRVIPSGMVHVVANILGGALTDDKIVLAFSIYNTFVLGIAVLTWKAIAKKLAWSPQVKWISFAGLFLNFAILKMNSYYPALTDTSAFVMSLIMFYFYVAHRPYCVLLTTIIGAFIFPTSIYVGLVLFVLSSPRQLGDSYYQKTHSMASVILTFSLVSMIIFLMYKLYAISGNIFNCTLGNYFGTPIIYASFVISFSFLFFALYPFFNHHQKISQRLIRQALNYKLLLGGVVFIGLNLLIKVLSSGSAGVVTPLPFIKVLAIRSIAYPAISLISHIIFFGPIICLLIYFWKDVINYLKDKESGLLVVMLFAILLSLDSESRELINFFATCRHHGCRSIKS